MSSKLEQAIQEAKAAVKQRSLADLKADFRKFIGNAHPSCVRVWVNEVTEDSVLLGSADATVPVEERKSFAVDRKVFPENVQKKQLWEVAISSADHSDSRKYLVGDVTALQRVAGYTADFLLAD